MTWLTSDPERSLSGSERGGEDSGEYVLVRCGSRRVLITEASTCRRLISDQESNASEGKHVNIILIRLP